ncbi:alpha/beta fold hydrolase [Pseudogemmobacter humi]|uniref:Haloacetate dehalogenase H-1 n=1 Tax=Pseudogemmobacter humi TaxID=2483812 RepID=A0A3P5XM74_9RHOB|nr:alpha/beta hydrolase [Pseudogemmobacter humi]VDC31342.1 Haloacetate dehalogenase H-1 [Pseudogemmobacter humi]
MSSGTQFFTAADGARLAWLDQGAGLPVLCLAGLTRGKEDFDPALPALTGARVIRMDYRGRGESAFTSAASYTPAQEAADALALLDHLGVARAAVLGTSRGGLIGMLLAAHAKDRLLGLCLNDIGPVVERDGLLRILDYLGLPPQARSLDEMAALLARGSPGFRDVPAPDWQAMAARLFRETPEGLALRYDPALRESFLAGFDPEAPPPDLWPWWQAAAGLPVALIRGANSDLLSLATVERMRETRPDLIFADVPDRGHVPFLNEPPAVEVLQAWLRLIRETEHSAADTAANSPAGFT